MPQEPVGPAPDSDSPQQRLQRLRRLSRLLDAQWRIPGTSIRLGLDPLIGLVPGLGDLLPVIFSAYIVYEAHRLGVAPKKLLRMIVNIVVDALVGSVPILGDIFDVAWKANQRNLRLIEDEAESRLPQQSAQ